MTTLLVRSQSHVDAMLYDYAMGTLDESQSLMIATYLTLSPDARGYTKMCETLGGTMLDTMCEPVSLCESAFDKIMQKAECVSQECHEQKCSEPYQWQNVTLPKLLQCYLDGKCAPFKTLYQGLEVAEVPTRCKNSKAQLMRIAPRTQIPDHTHDGLEMTLVLEGAFHDEHGVYKRGDLIVTDSTIHHHPIADEVEGCVCMVVTSAPVRLTGWKGRFFNIFINR